MRLNADEIEKVAYWLKNRAIPGIESDLNGIRKEIPKIGVVWTTQDGRESLDLIQNNVDSFNYNLGVLKMLADDLLKIANEVRSTQSAIAKGANKFGDRRDMIQ